FLAQDEAGPVFGDTVVSTSALQGKVYPIKRGTKHLPKFEKLRPAGSIYTTSLNVRPRSFRDGFPGVTKRQEWFAIEYTGKFWIEQASTYRFGMLSDDGSRLWIDDEMIVDLDGLHPPLGAAASVVLSRGSHRMRVQYYQGPGYEVALVLAVATPDRPFKIFQTDDFLPPRDPAGWIEGTISNIDRPQQPWIPK